MSDITEEALKWYNQNKDKECSDKYYPSPRVSSEFFDCSTAFSFDMYNFCSYGCLYCIDGETKISLHCRGNKSAKIKDIKVGDIIKTYNINTKIIEPKRVINTMNKESDEYYILHIKNKKIKITGEHPVYTKRGWINVKDLTLNDEVLWQFSQIPSISNNMKINNPMKNIDSRNKVSNTMINKNKINRENNIKHPNSGRIREDLSEYMKINNPSKNLERKKQISKTLSEYWTNKFKDPAEREKKSIQGKNTFINGTNRLCDPEVRKKQIEASRKSFLINKISDGQKLLYKKLEELNIKYIPEKTYMFSKGKGNWYCVDAYLPDYNIIIEYDGYHMHKTPEGKEKDNKRDEFFLKLGIKTLRIKQTEIFGKYFKIGDKIDAICKN